jgi:hypothetical protein
MKPVVNAKGAEFMLKRDDGTYHVEIEVTSQFSVSVPKYDIICMSVVEVYASKKIKGQWTTVAYCDNCVVDSDADLEMYQTLAITVITEYQALANTVIADMHSV